MEETYKLNNLEGKDIFNIINKNKELIDDYFWKYYKNITTDWIITHTKNICEFFNPYGDLLSIGCAYGLNEMYLCDMSKDITSVTGIDIIEFKIQTMNRILKLLGKENIIGILANGMKMDFPDQSFDTIIIIESLSHADVQDKVLKEAARVLKKNGSIFVLDFNNGANPRVWIRSWKQKHFEDIIENVVNPYYVRNRVLKLGFKDIVIKPYGHYRSFDYLKNMLQSKRMNLPSKFYLFVSKGFMLKGRKY